MNGRKRGPARVLAIMLGAVLMVSGMRLTVSADEQLPETSDVSLYEETAVTDNEAPVQEDNSQADDVTTDEGLPEDLPASDDKLLENDATVEDTVPSTQNETTETAEQPDSSESIEEPADETQSDTNVPAAASDESEITTWEQLQAALDAGGKVTLTQDITAAQNNTSLVVPSGVTVTLDLNGHTLQGPGTGVDKTEAAITVKGSLTMDGTGEIKPNGNFGVFMSAGSFTMNNGTITGSQRYGVQVSYNSRFTMNGGSITNSKEYDVAVVGTFTYGGGHLESLDVSIGPIVINNKLEETAPIRINGKLGVLTSGLKGNGTAADFKCEREDYRIVLNDDGEAVIVQHFVSWEYIARSWSDEGKVVSKTRERDGLWKQFPNITPISPGNYSLPAGYYYLNGNITIDGRLYLSGNTSLILSDEYTLDVKGLHVPKNSTLTIYGQSDGDDAGRLRSHPDEGTGIGAHSDLGGGNIIIHGGIIDSIGHDHCAGIGSNDGDGSVAGSFAMYGGIVTATGGSQGAGIGGGRDCDGGTITIYGGTVTAEGKDGAAGIGGGASSSRADNSTIYIYGGNVTAAGSSKGAGIGGGERGHAAITISGGEITANGGSAGGAGIGNGADGSASAVTLDYTTASKNTIRVTASSFNGTVTLKQLFMNKSYAFDPGEMTDDQKVRLADSALTAWAPAATMNGVSGTFKDKIKLNYYFDFTQDVLEDEGAYVTLTNSSTNISVKLPIKDAEYVTDKGYRFSIPLAAKEASDTIIAEVFDSQGNAMGITGNEYGDDYTQNGVPSSLMKYFTWLEEYGEDKEKPIGAAAKDYCSAAQIYFKHNADGLSVSSAVNNVTSETLSSYISGHKGTLPDGVTIKGISAMLESDNTLRLYFDFDGVEANSFSYAIDNAPADLIMRSDGLYYLAMKQGVWSDHLQDEHTYSVSDGTNTYTVTASVLTYARSCAIKSNENESNLGKTLYLYNKAAVDAFKN